MTVSVKVNWRNRKNNEVIEPETFGLFKGQVKPAPPAGAGKRPAEDVCQTLTFEVGTEDSGRNVKQLLKSKLATPTECLRLKHPPVSCFEIQNMTVVNLSSIQKSLLWFYSKAC